MAPESAPVETIEHSVCRQRTEEEQSAVEACTVVNLFVRAGAREIRLDPAFIPLDQG